jgi:hypothetical protein
VKQRKTPKISVKQCQLNPNFSFVFWDDTSQQFEGDPTRFHEKWEKYRKQSQQAPLWVSLGEVADNWKW